MRVAFFFFPCAAVVHEAVDERDALLVGDRDERGTIVKLHDGRLISLELRPLWQIFAVGIATGLGKVYPVLLHQVTHLLFLWVLIGLAIEGAFKIHDVIGMGCIL